MNYSKANKPGVMSEKSFGSVLAVLFCVMSVAFLFASAGAAAENPIENASTMKIIAIEVETPGYASEDFAPHLDAEARTLWRLYQEGFVREMYFRQDRTEAVLVLEAADVKTAEQKLQQLPLVKNGLISFELIPLRAYPGFERLFSSAEEADE